MFSVYLFHTGQKFVMIGGGEGVHGRVLPKLTVENRPQTQIKKNSAKIQLGFNVPSDYKVSSVLLFTPITFNPLKSFVCGLNPDPVECLCISN